MKPEIERLYEVGLDQFTKTRDEIVRELKDRGDADEARNVRALKKPSVAAWALNQLARRNRKELEWLFQVDTRLRKAQGSGNAEDFREATRSRHDLVRRLTDAAAAILQEAGHADSATTREKVAETLYAVGPDEQARERLRAGTLEREISAGGFGEIPVEPMERSTRASDDRERRRAEEREERLLNLRETAEELRNVASRLQSEADRLEREARQARREADRAVRRAEEAAEKLKEAEG